MIDIHCHISPSPMRGLHTPVADAGALRELAGRHGIELVCLMATLFPLKGTGRSLEEIRRLTDDDPLFAIFATVNLEQPDSWLPGLERDLSSGRLSGIKLYPGYQDAPLAVAAPVLRFAAHHGLPVAVHLGELHHCCPAAPDGSRAGRCGRGSCAIDRRAGLAAPGQLLPVAREHPDVTFIASHLGNPWFAELRSVMACCPNVVTDISGQFLSATSEASEAYRCLVAEEIRRFVSLPRGDERVLFGSDFPIQSHADTLDLLARLGLAGETMDRITRGNAARILGRN